MVTAAPKRFDEVMAVIGSWYVAQRKVYLPNTGENPTCTKEELTYHIYQ